MRKLVFLMAFALNGCSAPIIGVLTIDEMFSVFSIASTVLTGKSFGEHAMDVATGDDCRLIESVVRKDREVCEPLGSPATLKDFKGVASLVSFSDEESPASPLVGFQPLPIEHDDHFYQVSFSK